MSKKAAIITSIVLASVVILLLIIAQNAFDPNTIDRHWTGRPMPPCFVNAEGCYGHLLGTDGLGRDILSRLGRGGQVSLGLSLVALVFELTIGITFGMLSRRGGDSLRFAVLRFGDAISCFPAWPMLLGIVVIATPQNKASLPATALAFLAAALYSPQIIRRIAIGGDLRGLTRSVSSQCIRDLMKIIALLAFLDFFGYGIQPPTATWGNMLTEAELEVTIAWWVGAFPSLCLFAVIFGLEIFRRSMFGPDSSRELESSSG